MEDFIIQVLSPAGAASAVWALTWMANKRKDNIKSNLIRLSPRLNTVKTLIMFEGVKGVSHGSSNRLLNEVLEAIENESGSFDVLLQKLKDAEEMMIVGSQHASSAVESYAREEERKKEDKKNEQDRTESSRKNAGPS